MLYLIGVGLSGDDIPYSGLHAVNNCDIVYCEWYTNLPGTEREELEKILDMSISVVGRKDVEEKEFIINEAERHNVALLVFGDPLAATTHIDLMLRAKKKGIDVKIIHAASIFSAVSETGLQLYKFGKTVSLVYPEKNYSPTSFYDAVVSNKERGLHTLLLLDIKEEEQRYMNPNEAFEIIEEADEKKIVERIVAISRLGREDQQIVYGSIDDLKSLTYGAPPHCLIVPGNLHFLEEEFLEYFKVKK